MSERQDISDSSLWSGNFIALIITNGIFFAGFHLLLPVLPLYVSQMGGSATEVGLVAGIFVFSAIIIRLLSDVIKQWLGTMGCLFLGIVISLICALGYAMISSVNGVLAIRILHGVGFGVATTFYATLAATIIPKLRKGEGMGYFGLGTTVAMAIAPAVGLWLALDYGYDYVFYFALACQIVALVWTYFCHFSRHYQFNDRTAKQKVSIIDQFAVKGARFPAFLTLLFGIGYGSVLNFVSIFAKQNHIGSPGYFFLVSTVCVCIARLFSGRIYDKQGPAFVIVPGIILFLVSFFGIAHTSGEFGFILCSIAYGFGLGALFPAFQTQILTRVAEDKSSAASATFYNMLDIGNGLGAIAYGMIAVTTGYTFLFTLSGWIMVLMLVLFTVVTLGVGFHSTRAKTYINELASEEAGSSINRD
ncbi:MFS transporter [Vibrio sp. CAIM 722]|uniref:MFS transporter n=1 Tax=Vibrio eleionomae TaxID=2653505 RepID=A0A7X4LJE8_9VIBR|nr:MFS transporter [Vibrio eleionomae]MZI92855.1 MFS transporter [Vibrio eleionomae]